MVRNSSLPPQGIISHSLSSPSDFADPSLSPSRIVDMMKEKLSNSETPEEQSHGRVAWERDVYFQVLENLKKWQ
ncbi:hypothetical protein H5410_002501 [Solanum commersonii]|uniref:Uncharacterized protein n=1 Tax=Solanum commersonii TaxID=4109 RepID=A0A9J6B296_SOLCO|nr:hypothetical protein H5410_002501 [Solanum commersonii]